MYLTVLEVNSFCKTKFMEWRVLWSGQENKQAKTNKQNLKQNKNNDDNNISSYLLQNADSGPDTGLSSFLKLFPMHFSMSVCFRVLSSSCPYDLVTCTCLPWRYRKTAIFLRNSPGWAIVMLCWGPTISAQTCHAFLVFTTELNAKALVVIWM